MKWLVAVPTFMLGAIALITGAIWFMLGLDALTVLMGQDLGLFGDSYAFRLADSAIRFFAGIWFVVGLGLFYTLGNLAQRTQLFRLSMLAIFVGGLGRILSVVQVGVAQEMLPPILIELILPPLLVFFQARLSRA